jgi:hypothetical protein
MSRWFRLYDDLVDDPKVQRLGPDLFKALINLWCLASKNDGMLPSLDEMAFKLRVRPERLDKILKELIACGLIDETPDGGHEPHNWNGRQYKSDVSNERVKRYRDRKRNAECNVTVAPPETEADTETEKKEDAADAAPSKYVFESGVIRLSKKHFDKWCDAYSNLDLKAELMGLTQWAGQQPDWFFAVSGALAKRNREQAIRLAEARAKQPIAVPRHLEGIQ